MEPERGNAKPGDDSVPDNTGPILAYPTSPEARTDPGERAKVLAERRLADRFGKRERQAINHLLDEPLMRKRPRRISNPPGLIGKRRKGSA